MHVKRLLVDWQVPTLVALKFNQFLEPSPRPFEDITKKTKVLYQCVYGVCIAFNTELTIAN